MHSRYSLLGYIALTFGIVSPASADVINTYSDVGSWTLATTVLATIPFSVSAPFENSLTLSGATFSTSGVETFDVVDTTGSPYWGYGTGLALEILSSNVQPVLQVTLPTGTTSFGLNLSALGDLVTITVNGTPFTIPTVNSSNGSFAFFGATFDAPITSFTISAATEDFLFVDNVSFGTVNTGGDPSPTPEVATLLMIGAGLISMRMMNKRMHLFN
jgi:hypothetical protein